jgi:CCR4-NOT transcription complex subunit 2
MIGLYRMCCSFYQVQNAGLRPPSQISSFGTYDQFRQQYQQPQTQIPFRLQHILSDPHPYRDQSSRPVQGGITLPDPYGLMGLLGVLKMDDYELSSLALGLDLTTLGLNLNSPDNLYKAFGSPWSNEPAKGDLDFHIPACYFAEPPQPLQVSTIYL